MMVDEKGTRDESVRGRLPRAESTESDAGAELFQPPSRTSSTGADFDKSFHPLTVFVTVTLPPSTYSQDLTPRPTPISLQSSPISSSSLIASSSSSSSARLSSSSHIWQPIQVGHVVAESEVPYEWGPQRRRHRQATSADIFKLHIAHFHFHSDDCHWRRVLEVSLLPVHISQWWN
jgi:hypothetical protein